MLSDLSGFKESIIREKFSYISLCFCDWESAREILINRDICLLTTLDTFGHRQKINAILKLAEIIELEGFERLKAKILKSPLKQLQIIPFIGEITTWHLAKNLGLSVAKPDRHLVRLANFLGYTDVQRLCRDVADIADEPVNVVDIVFWRYCTFTPTRAFV